jgi:hypothetical protein
MAEVHAIKQYPVYSMWAGIDEFYNSIHNRNRQRELDAYAKEKDDKTFGLKEQELEAMRERMALESYTAGLRMQHEGGLAQNKLDWEKDPTNSENIYRLTVAEVAMQKAKTDAGLAFSQIAESQANRRMLDVAARMWMDAYGGKAGQPATPLSSMTAPNTLSPEDKFVVQPITAAQQYAPTTPSLNSLSDAELRALVLQQQRAMRGIQGYDGSSWITPRQVGTDSRGAVR